MAKLYLLSEEHIKNGTRPKTPREKQMWWRKAFVVLTILVIIEHVVIYYWIN